MSALPLLLIAEDDPDARALYRLALQETFELRFAADGLEAWEALMEVRPRLLLTDLNMPRLNGLELVRRARAEPDLSGLRIAIVTGTTVGSDLPPSFWKLAVDADVILEKPLSPHALLKALQALLVPREATGDRTPPPVVEYLGTEPVRNQGKER